MSVELIKRYDLTFDDFNLDDRVAFKRVLLNLWDQDPSERYLRGEVGFVVDRTPSFVKVKLEKGSFFVGDNGQEKQEMWFLAEHLQSV